MIAAAHHSMMGGKRGAKTPFLRFNTNGQGTNQSINLGIAPNISDVYEITCRRIPGTSGDTQFFGVYAGNDSRDARLFFTSGTVLYWDFGNRRANAEYSEFVEGTNFMTCVCNNKSLSTALKTVPFQAYTGTLSPYSMFLFGIRWSASNTSSSSVAVDIARFKITRGGEPFMDLLPQRGANNTGYMVDAISGNEFRPMANGQYQFLEE